ncbi:hypothetical protein [Lacrimispora sp.]|uniref:hypothetical protein n=1 Tax=Lacrimispora sp. TaxID=2719234 RepID=UPI0039939A3A
MDSGLKRFTISLTADMEAELRVVRKTYFNKVTRNEMMKELIRRGLKAVAADGGRSETNT